MTTARFLEVFALGSLRDLPDLDALGAAGAGGREIDDEIEGALDDARGLFETPGARDDNALTETDWEARQEETRSAMKGAARPVELETPRQTGAAHARRQILRMVASGAALFAAWARALAVDKLVKSDVDYRDRPKGKERCDNCRFGFRPTPASQWRGRFFGAAGANISRPEVVQNTIVPYPEEWMTKDDVAYQNAPKGGSAATTAKGAAPPTPTSVQAQTVTVRSVSLAKVGAVERRPEFA